MPGAGSKHTPAQVASTGWWGCQQTEQQAGDRDTLFIPYGWRDIKAGGEGQNVWAQSAAHDRHACVCHKDTRVPCRSTQGACIFLCEPSLNLQYIFTCLSV